MKKGWLLHALFMLNVFSLVFSSVAYAENEVRVSSGLIPQAYKKVVLMNGTYNWGGDLMSNSVAGRLIKNGINVVDFKTAPLIIQQKVIKEGKELLRESEKAKKGEQIKLASDEDFYYSVLERQYRIFRDNLDYFNVDGIVETGFTGKFYVVKLIDIKTGEIRAIGQEEAPAPLAEEFADIFLPKKADSRTDFEKLIGATKK